MEDVPKQAVVEFFGYFFFFFNVGDVFEIES